MKKMLDLQSERYMKFLLELCNQEYSGNLSELRINVTKEYGSQFKGDFT